MIEKEDIMDFYPDSTVYDELGNDLTEILKSYIVHHNLPIKDVISAVTSWYCGIATTHFSPDDISETVKKRSYRMLELLAITQDKDKQH